MEINVKDRGLDSIVNKAIRTMKAVKPLEYEYMQNDSFDISLGSAGIDMGAAMNPLYVGKHNLGRLPARTPQLDSLYKAGRMGVGYKYNAANGRWDGYFAEGKPRKEMTGDSFTDAMRGLTMDAAGPIIAGSLYEPNQMNWITEVFKEPLAWSGAIDLVKVQPGTNPWATVQAMAAMNYSGSSAVNTAGGVDNTMSQDVGTKVGMLTQQIINIRTTYKLTVEELERAKYQAEGFPLGGQLIAQKQAYAKWLPDIIRDSLIYYGNPATGNAGLFTVNSITAWTSVGSNQALSTIAADTGNTAKGSAIYQQFAGALRSFLSGMQNKCRKVNVRMSVDAFNIFASVPYSDVYNPDNAFKVTEGSFGADGRIVGSMGGVKVEIGPDPMLNGSGKGNEFNGQTYDYLVLTADELGGGPDDENQSLIHWGEPLGDFVYPVVPQSFSTQYAYLKRVSGVFAPYNYAVKVYSGYGYAS